MVPHQPRGVGSVTVTIPLTLALMVGQVAITMGTAYIRSSNITSSATAHAILRWTMMIFFFLSAKQYVCLQYV